MNQNPGTEVVAAATAAVTAPAKAKKIVRVAGAAVFSFAMFGAFALPAYALNAPAEAEIEPQASVSQSITIPEGLKPVAIEDIPLEVDTSVVEQERLDRELKEAEKLAIERQNERVSIAAVEVPAGVGAGGLVNAALAQVGVYQDCTDLVQNALAAIGLTERRDQGGYDHGVSDFFRYGASTPYVHGTTALAAGDILMWPGAPHVAIYIGNGQAVHGGWGASLNETAVAGISTYAGYPTDVVRMS